MPKKRTPSVAEIKSLLMAGFNEDILRRQKIHAYLSKKIFNEQPAQAAPENDPENIAFRNDAITWLSEVMARRLKRNRRTTPLISSRDAAPLASFLLKSCIEEDGSEYSKAERQEAEKQIKTTFTELIKMMYAILPPRMNLYDECWQKINVVLDLAAERGVAPTELFAFPGISDEITRRTRTKRQFIALVKKTSSSFTNVNSLKKFLLQISLGMIPDVDKKIRSEIAQGIKEDVSELMPEIRKTAEKAKKVIDALLKKEVARIYKTTK